MREVGGTMVSLIPQVDGATVTIDLSKESTFQAEWLFIFGLVGVGCYLFFSRKKR